MRGNFGRETCRKPWKLRSTGVGVIKTSRRKSRELRLTVILRSVAMFYLGSKPVCLINRQNDREQATLTAQRLTINSITFNKQPGELYKGGCAPVYNSFGDRYTATSVNLRSREEQTHAGDNGRWQIAVRACLCSNASRTFRSNLYSLCQIRHTCYLARVASTSRPNWTRVNRTPIPPPVHEMFALRYRRFC